MACMLSCFRGCGLIPSSVSVTPMYDNSVFLSWNLSTFSFICFCWHRSSKADSRASWLDVASSMVLPSPQMRMSSAMALLPSSPSKLSSILLWNSSGATLMPKGILFHFILPTGVLKVVSRELCSSSWYHWTKKRIYSCLRVEQMCGKFGAVNLDFICTGR